MKQVNKYLKHWTGRDAEHWMNRIGVLIHKCAKPIKGHKGLFSCEPVVWVKHLTEEITTNHKKCPKEADENILVAKLLSIVLVLWSYRIGRAKCHDPRRPVKQRRQGLERAVAFGSLIAKCLLDETHDPRFFPAQEWDVPHSSHARYEPDEVELKRQKYAKGNE